ncbi:ammonium Transporter family protein, partial [Vibrio parahaemolyticus V-223/04]
LRRSLVCYCLVLVKVNTGKTVKSTQFLARTCH